jgi:hypothetical protein
LPQRARLEKLQSTGVASLEPPVPSEGSRLLGNEIYWALTSPKLFRGTTISGAMTKFWQHSASSKSEGSVLELSRTTLRLTQSCEVATASSDAPIDSGARVTRHALESQSTSAYVSARHTTRRLDALARIASGSTSSLTSMSHRSDVVPRRRLLVRSSKNRVDFIRYQGRSQVDR